MSIAHASGKEQVMSADSVTMSFSRASVCLVSGCGISCRYAAGVVLISHAGRDWPTMEGAARDIDLPPGAPYRIERDGLTRVKALEPSCLEVRVPRAERASWRERLLGVWNWLARAAERRARARMARGNFHF